MDRDNVLQSLLNNPTTAAAAANASDVAAAAGPPRPRLVVLRSLCSWILLPVAYCSFASSCFDSAAGAQSHAAAAAAACQLFRNTFFIFSVWLFWLYQIGRCPRSAPKIFPACSLLVVIFSSLSFFLSFFSYFHLSIFLSLALSFNNYFSLVLLHFSVSQIKLLFVSLLPSFVNLSFKFQCPVFLIKPDCSIHIIKIDR